jgi:hypothetical protein
MADNTAWAEFEKTEYTRYGELGWSIWLAAWTAALPSHTKDCEVGTRAIIQKIRDQARYDEGNDDGKNLAVNFCVNELSSMLGDPAWTACDGTETWDGDVSGTLYNILVAAGVINPEDNSVARHSQGEFGANEAWRDLCEKDRTSDHPDMCLITQEELSGYIAAAWTARAPAQDERGDAERFRWLLERQAHPDGWKDTIYLRIDTTEDGSGDIRALLDTDRDREGAR